jgi:enterochelin esterase-like enzyme
LLDALPGDPSHVIVTFVWRSGTNKSVLLLTSATSIAGRDVSKMQMTHLEGTDVWFRAYKMRADLRFTYRFGPDATLAAFLIPGAFSFDPLNPKKLVADRDAENPDANIIEGSIAELPQAPAERWITSNPTMPRGALVMERIHSDKLGNERRIWTYLPPGYAPQVKPYPVLMCFDGFGYTHGGAVNAPTILDNLIAAHRIPPIVGLFVDVSWSVRNVELTNHRAFIDFLTAELLPWAHAKWNFSKDPGKTIVCGYSAGGLTSGYAAMTRPDVFGNVLSQSGAYWRGNEGDEEHFEYVVDLVKASTRLPVRFVLQVGTVERGATPNDGPSLLQANRDLRDALRARGNAPLFVEEPGGHEALSWRDGLADGLIALFGTK